LNNTKIIVTGGAGFIGSNLVDALIERGLNVHVIDNLSNGKKENVNKKAKLHVLDITDINSIKPVFRGTEYVFHLAALPRVQYSIEQPAESNKTNVEGTLNVLISATGAKVKKVIYSASSSAYGDQARMPLKEDFIPSPKSPYGLQKYLGELYCRLWSDVYKLPTVSLRYFNVYGPRYNPDGAYALVIGKFLKQRLNILAMESKKVGRGEVMNIGSGKNQSINKIAQLIGGPMVYIPARLEPKHTLADNSLARKLLGWRPEVKLEDGISDLKSMAGLK
jgi:nucleoside-diphosphate-sugar epimerase